MRLRENEDSRVLDTVRPLKDSAFVVLTCFEELGKVLLWFLHY